MVTFRSETDEAVTVTTDQGVLTLPTSATREQAAAIAAAVSAHTHDQLVAARAASGDEEATWEGERFAFAGRLEAVTGYSHRVPSNAPTDRWTASGRRDRYDR